jgi:hypothetical protein
MNLILECLLGIDYTPPPLPSSTKTTDFGKFNEASIVKGQDDITFSIGPDFPPLGYIIFQTWDINTGVLSAIYTATGSPFTYPSLILKDVTSGVQNVQAIIRNGNNENVAIIKQDVEFKDPEIVILPSNVLKNDEGYFNLTSKDSVVISNETVKAIRGVNIENNQSIGKMAISNCGFTTTDYGIYSGSCGDFIITDTNIISGPGENSYCLRGNFGTIFAKNTVFDNRNGSKVCLRPYDCFNAIFDNCKILGGPIWLGGGNADSNIDFRPCENFVFKNIEADHSQNTIDWLCFYPGANNIVFENVKVRLLARFASIWDGAYNITFKNVQVSNDGVRYRPLEWADIKNGDIISQQTERNITIE